MSDSKAKILKRFVNIDALPRLSDSSGLCVFWTGIAIWSIIESSCHETYILSVVRWEIFFVIGMDQLIYWFQWQTSSVNQVKCHSLSRSTIFWKSIFKVDWIFVQMLWSFFFHTLSDWVSHDFRQMFGRIDMESLDTTISSRVMKKLIIAFWSEKKLIYFDGLEKLRSIWLMEWSVISG